MIINDDILNWCKEYKGKKFHALLCDPPYELNFMNKGWDNTGIAFREDTWEALKEHLHPGAFCFAFASTRGLHRMMVAIEDAGCWEEIVGIELTAEYIPIIEARFEYYKKQIELEKSMQLFEPEIMESMNKANKAEESLFGTK